MGCDPFLLRLPCILLGSGQVGRGSICFQHVQDWSKLGSGTLDYFQQRRQKVDQDHPLFDMRIRHNAYSKNIHLVPVFG